MILQSKYVICDFLTAAAITEEQDIMINAVAAADLGWICDL